MDSRTTINSEPLREVYKNNYRDENSYTSNNDDSLREKI